MQIQYSKNLKPGRFELSTKQEQNKQYVVKSRPPRNFKTGHFKWLTERKRAAKYT